MDAYITIDTDTGASKFIWSVKVVAYGREYTRNGETDDKDTATTAAETAAGEMLAVLTTIDPTTPYTVKG